MEMKSFLQKPGFLGVALFLVTQIIQRLNYWLVDNLVSKEWTPANDMIVSISNFIFWLCMPFSKIFVVLTRNIQLPLFLYKHPQIIHITLNLLGWLAVAFLINRLQIKNQARTSSANK